MNRLPRKRGFKTQHTCWSKEPFIQGIWISRHGKKLQIGEICVGCKLYDIDEEILEGLK